MEAGDLNGEGKADVLIYRDSDGTLYTGLSNGSGGYNLVTPGFTHIRVADFDGDGKSDVILYRTDGTCFMARSASARWR